MAEPDTHPVPASAAAAGAVPPAPAAAAPSLAADSPRVVPPLYGLIAFTVAAVCLTILASQRIVPPTRGALVVVGLICLLLPSPAQGVIQAVVFIVLRGRVELPPGGDGGTR